MSLSDKLSPEDRRAYAEAYEPLAKLRDAYVAYGDRANAKRIRRQISELSSYYQKRAIRPTSVWFDESSQFTNSTDMPEYGTNGRACINLTHLLSKDQMLEIARLAHQTYRDECLQAMGMKPIEYDQHRAIKQFKRGMSLYPQVLHSFIEQHGYRKIQPYSLEVAQRQVAEAHRVYPHHFKSKSELPERFYNHAVGHQAPDVAHFDKDAALHEAERIARRTNAEVRTYQLVSTTTIEDVPTTTKKVVRRP